MATDWDGVHLSFGGMLTTEGIPLRLAGGDGTMLEGWQQEQTCWFRWVFGESQQLPDWTEPLPA
jgi:hypothetical protein